MRSALYFGRVRHRRTGGVEHAFEYGHFLLALDLGELAEVFRGRWLWSVGRPNVVSFRREDYLGGAGPLPLERAVRERVRQELGREPLGPIVLLCQPRFLGYVFNPVSFYHCLDPQGRPDAIVAEITNTPWGERHSYVIDARAGVAQARFAKRFHVSPFQDMGQEYEWRFGELGPTLDVQMTNFERGRPVFEAQLTMRRRPLDGRGLARALLACPGLSLRSIAAIYWQALRLRLKGAPFFEHPRTRAPLPEH